MREIKFRAWNVINKQMHRDVQDAYDWAETDDVVLEADYFGDLLRDSDFIVEQYTGLKDKNGVEIYENDIVIEGGNTVVVKWDDAHARWEYKTETGSAGMYLFAGEVIGNIHENPELLK